jgi:hypothetical protein
MNRTNHYSGEDHPQYRHGMTNTPEFWAWSAMINRCTNARNKAFPRYGGRGIKVCDRWLSSFENFLADVGTRPAPDLSIDRWPDKNGNYEPGNVRWATRREQQNNVRNNRIVVYHGVEYSLAEAVRASKGKVTRTIAKYRLARGWSVDDALDTPRTREHGKEGDKRP